jgi:hypothetical protein
MVLILLNVHVVALNNHNVSFVLENQPRNPAVEVPAAIMLTVAGLAKVIGKAASQSKAGRGKGGRQSNVGYDHLTFAIVFHAHSTRNGFDGADEILGIVTRVKMSFIWHCLPPSSDGIIIPKSTQLSM